MTKSVIAGAFQRLEHDPEKWFSEKIMLQEL